MPAHTEEQTRLISCRSSADLLAALPQLTGFTAENSIFVIMFAGKRAGGTFRLDLPSPEDARRVAELPDVICRILDEVGTEHRTTAAPVVVIACSQTFAESGGTPWRGLAKRIERRLKRAGLGVRDLCCLAPDGWASYLDSDTPPAGHPLAEISENPISLNAHVDGRTMPDLSSLGAVPAPDAERARAVAAALEALPPYDFPDPERTPPPRSGSVEERAHAYASFAPTAGVARALLLSEGPLSPRMTARLIRTAANSDRWMQLALAVMTRPEFPGELAHEIGPERFTSVPVDIDADAEPSPRAGWSIRRVLWSTSSDFMDRERLPQVREKLLTAISETPERLRPPLIAFSAWVWWLAGSQTVAGRQVREARAIDPDDALTAMVARLIRTPCFYRPAGEPSVGAPAGAGARRHDSFTRSNSEAA